MRIKTLLVGIVSTLLMSSCGTWKKPQQNTARLPKIFPDYIGVTIPKNIAPLNFAIEGATHIQAVLSSTNKMLQVSGGDFIDIDIDEWHSLIDEALKGEGTIKVEVAAWTEADPDGIRYKPFEIKISPDEIDSYVAYRLIPPGYELWNKMGLYERNLATFDESTIIENKQINNGCVNCHSFSNYDAEQGTMFHARGRGGGTIVYQRGQIEKIALEKIGPQMNGTYPMWHPSNNFIVFSSNMTRQSFYGHSKDKIEVYDQKSDLFVYDVRKKEIYTDPRFTDSLNWETFPAFSPDGKWLFFCTAKPAKMPIYYDKLHYSICRVSFNPDTGRLGSFVDTIYSANKQGGSASFPRISPDGKYLLYTLADCATFPIHHKEADLRMIELDKDNKNVDVSVLNSTDVDSYHSWSSTGRWVVLSSKRIDGRYTRLFLSHWDGRHFSKPFLLPQRNPWHNRQRMYSYNVPEFIINPIHFDSEELGELFNVVE